MVGKLGLMLQKTSPSWGAETGEDTSWRTSMKLQSMSRSSWGRALGREGFTLQDKPRCEGLAVDCLLCIFECWGWMVKVLMDLSL
ncbi:kinesin-like protein KIF26A isoform X4 [Tachysurus ichikawai]